MQNQISGEIHILIIVIPLLNWSCLFSKCGISSDKTGNHDFWHMSVICVSYVFYHGELKYVARSAVSPTALVFFFLVCYQCVQVWLKYFTVFQIQCRHENLVITKIVGMSAQSQPARPCWLRHVWTCWGTKLTVRCAGGILHCVWCARVCCDKLEVLCVLFNEVSRAKGLCLLYFHHAREVFKSTQYLLLCVW